MKLIRVTPGENGVPSVLVETVREQRNVLLEWPAAGSPPDAVRGTATLLDLGVTAGAARWQLTYFEPDSQCLFHRTHTVDCHVVMGGTLELLLGGDRVVVLAPGDLLMVAGVDHAWRAGDDGALTCATLFGIPADSDELAILPSSVDRLTWDRHETGEPDATPRDDTARTL